VKANEKTHGEAEEKDPAHNRSRYYVAHHGYSANKDSTAPCAGHDTGIRAVPEADAGEAGIGTALQRGRLREPEVGA
jgi:hypothetical protein